MFLEQDVHHPHWPLTNVDVILLALMQTRQPMKTRKPGQPMGTQEGPHQSMELQRQPIGIKQISYIENYRLFCCYETCEKHSNNCYRF